MSNKYIEPNIEFALREVVWDDLTGTKATIVRISVGGGSDSPTVGYWLDNDYLGGGRHPWEITKLKDVIL